MSCADPSWRERPRIDLWQLVWQRTAPAHYISRRVQVNAAAPRFTVSKRHVSLQSSHLVQIEIINTGSELMLGRVLNTHQQWLCRQLSDLGYVVTRQVAVPDEGAQIQAAEIGRASCR